MPSQNTSAGSPNNFAMFPNLPEELRLMIWKRALPGPRAVELEYRYGDPVPGGSILIGHFTSSCPIPVILSVCQESRSEGQAEYELSFPTVGSRPKVYFNPSIDTLVLSWLGGLANTAFPTVRYDIFDKVEHICFTSWKLEYALRHLDNDHIDAYSSLKTITVATDIDSPEPGLGQLSIVEDQFTEGEQAHCAVKIEDFVKRFVERHPNRNVPTVMVRSIKRHR